MGEYIEREAAVAISSYAEDEHPYKKFGTPETYSNYNEGWSDACDYIRGKMESTPGADVAPVKHGEWIGYQTNSFKNSSEGLKRKFYRCSICRTANAIRVNYCPNCGAKMDL